MLPYLSPSSINQYLDDQEEFFLRYIVRVPRIPQTQPMAIGSAFDACVKAYLMLWPDVDPAKHVELYQEYFEDTVEPQNRDWAHTKGIIVFNMYKESGALGHLTSDVEPGSLQPLETVESIIAVDGGSVQVPILGKPDLLWVSKAHGCMIVDDWKCNGAVSKYSKSPNPGYVDIFPSRDMHKNCQLSNGVNVLDIHPDYQLQLVIYKFLTGAEIVGISQLVFGKSPASDLLGDLRVALHRHRVSAELEERVKGWIALVWGKVTSYKEGGPFGDLTEERCAQLTEQADILKDPVLRLLSGR